LTWNSTKAELPGQMMIEVGTNARGGEFSRGWILHAVCSVVAGPAPWERCRPNRS